MIGPSEFDDGRSLLTPLQEDYVRAFNEDNPLPDDDLKTTVRAQLAEASE